MAGFRIKCLNTRGDRQQAPDHPYKTGERRQSTILRLSDRIVVFSQRWIEQVKPELYTKHATRCVAEFIGDSDVLAAEIVAVEGGRGGML